MKLRLFGGLILPFAFLRAALAGEPVPFMNEGEFRTLAETLALKVNLFQEAWHKDPEAEFYGGTTRDYLYWLKGQFRNAKSHEDVEKVIAQLKALPRIDVRDFIIGESDIDIISKNPPPLQASDFGVHHMDFRSPEIFDLKTAVGKNELDQGHIPAEKIRLSKHGFVKTPALGDGLHEIFQGKLTVHFTPPEQFANSHYAKQKLNHPILLAMRFLRLEAMDYFQSYGIDFPIREKLLDIDPESAKQVRSVIQSARENFELQPFLSNPQFAKWLNGSIQKAFRSYTNPTAAMMLMQEFNVPALVSAHIEIQPLNQYLFAKSRDPLKISKALEDYRVNKNHFYLPLLREFPDGRLYHGAKTDENFRGILMQGVLPSKAGNAGEGLYAVNLTERTFAENWQGGSKDRLVQFEIKPDAKIADITQGEGKRVWESFQAKTHSNDYERFTDLFGIDILAYPYTPRAYVVKNSAVLTRPEGTFRTILTFSKALERAKNIKTYDDVTQFIDQDFQFLNVDEIRLLAREIVQNQNGILTKANTPHLTETFIDSPVGLEVLAELQKSGITLRLPKTKAALKAFTQKAVTRFESFSTEVDAQRLLQSLQKRNFNRSLAKEWFQQSAKFYGNSGPTALKKVELLLKEGLLTADHFSWLNERGLKLPTLAHYSFRTYLEFEKVWFKDEAQKIHSKDGLVQAITRIFPTLNTSEQEALIEALASQGKFSLFSGTPHAEFAELWNKPGFENPELRSHIKPFVQFANERLESNEVRSIQALVERELEAPQPRFNLISENLMAIRQSPSLNKTAFKWVQNELTPHEIVDGQKQNTLSALLDGDVFTGAQKTTLAISIEGLAKQRPSGSSQSTDKILESWISSKLVGEFPKTKRAIIDGYLFGNRQDLLDLNRFLSEPNFIEDADSIQHVVNALEKAQQLDQLQGFAQNFQIHVLEHPKQNTSHLVDLMAPVIEKMAERELARGWGIYQSGLLRMIELPGGSQFAAVRMRIVEKMIQYAESPAFGKGQDYTRSKLAALIYERIHQPGLLSTPETLKLVEDFAERHLAPGDCISTRIKDALNTW